MDVIENKFQDYFITTDTSKMNVVAIHNFLTHSDWSKGIAIEKVQSSIENSLNFGLFYNDTQIGFARVISDFSTIAYLGDIYVLEKYRGLGLSKKLMDTVINHPNLQDLRRWILLTSTADWLYEQYGFKHLAKPEIYMEKYNLQFYKKTPK